MPELGKSGIQVPSLCLGGNVFGWTADEPTSFQILDASLDAGLNFIDTADIYARWAFNGVGGQSEEVLGRWMKQRGNRKRVVLATKVGLEMAADKKGLSARYIAQAVEDSLRRLQTDYIDLYQSHKDDPDTPVEETMGAFARLVEQGKVRALGASNFGPERLVESLKVSEKHGWPRYETLQPHYNLAFREEFESTLQGPAKARQLTVLPYWSLASGFLTGKYRSQQDLGKSPRGKDAGKYLNERGYKILAALDKVAGRHQATPTRVSLAWLMARNTIPIASATSVDQLQELILSTKLSLDAADMAELDQASA